MNYSFHSEAEIEFNEAIEFYEARRESLGEEFADEVHASIRRILQYPESWPTHSKRTRRCLCRRFPYSVIYRIKNNDIVIFAIMHHKQKPGYWKDRS